MIALIVLKDVMIVMDVFINVIVIVKITPVLILAIFVTNNATQILFIA